MFFWVFLFSLPLFSEFYLDEEPDFLEEVWNYSEILEAPEKPDPERRFQGFSRWRFKSDKPNAETFGSKTPAQHINPLYLYNRTSVMFPAAGGKSAMDFVFLRRDETSQGASELPITADTWRKRYFLRHASIGWTSGSFGLWVGDYLFGWGQGLFSYDRPGSSFRPFLLDKQELKIQAARSSYENLGVRGAAIHWKGEKHSLFLSLAETPLDGRVDPVSGSYLEELSGLRESLYGELGRPLDLIRRDRLHEKSINGRFGLRSGGHSLGFAMGYSVYDRFIRPQPSIQIHSFPTRWDSVFQAQRSFLAGFDWSYRRGLDTLFLESVLSHWQDRPAPAFTAGLRHKSRQKEHAFGVFYLAPRYFSRLGDGVRLGSSSSSNRYGFFSANKLLLERQEIGGRLYIERNIESEFSGHSASHSPYDSKTLWSAALDDRIKIGRQFFIYARQIVESSPYLVDARSLPVTISLLERKSRLETGRARAKSAFAVGWDHSRLSADNFKEERSHGNVFYARGRISLNSSLKFHAKLSRFDLGSPLFGRRFLYMSSSEFYWSGLSLGAIAYQSLFASYAPRGSRAAFALENATKSGLGVWIKLGATVLSRAGQPAVPKDSSQRDSIFSLVKLDFKTEAVLRW